MGEESTTESSESEEIDDDDDTESPEEKDHLVRSLKFYMTLGQFITEPCSLLSLGKLLFGKNYSKILGIRFAIWYPNRVETGEPIRFVYETKNKYLFSSPILSNT